VQPLVEENDIIESSKIESTAHAQQLKQQGLFKSTPKKETTSTNRQSEELEQSQDQQNPKNSDI
jgi:Ca2+-dependent lipid-binding protein